MEYKSASPFAFCGLTGLTAIWFFGQWSTMRWEGRVETEDSHS
jgi:hypothetical protein